jgi:hypothetical protein
MNITPTQLNFVSTSNTKIAIGKNTVIFCVRQLAVKKNFKQPGFTPGPLGVYGFRIPSENSSGQ